MYLKIYIKDVQEDERFNLLKSIGELADKMAEEHKHILFHKVYLLLKLEFMLHVAATSVEYALLVMKLVYNVRNK